MNFPTRKGSWLVRHDDEWQEGKGGARNSLEGGGESKTTQTRIDYPRTGPEARFDRKRRPTQKSSLSPIKTLKKTE